MSTHQPTPTEKAFLQRVINSEGQPSDSKGPITGGGQILQNADVDMQALLSAQTTDTGTPQMLETGIKVVDLLAPLQDGGLTILDGPYGVGKMVLCSEIMHTMIEKQNATIVVVALGETGYEASQFGMAVLEAQFQAQTIAIFETEDVASAERCRHMLHMGFTIAQHIRAEGHAVFLVLDNDVVTSAQIYTNDTLRGMAQRLQVTTVIMADSKKQKVALAAENTHIMFDRVLAKAKYYPAVDRLHSTAAEQLNAVLSSHHRHIAQRVREALQKGEALQDKGTLTAEEQQELASARRLNLFLTQPFFVAEPFSGVPGEYLLLEETLKDCQEILSGRYNTLPEQAFLMVGPLDQAIDKGKQLQ